MYDLLNHPFHHIGLMLDYDGTLTPIVESPKDARITTAKLDILKQFAQNPKISLAIVSGRSIGQLEDFLDELTSYPVIFCGLHGGEVVQYPERSSLKTPQPHILKEIEHFKTELESLLSMQKILEKVLFEDKGFSLAMHYRQADEETKVIALQCFCTIFQHLDSNMESFRSQSGKEVLEIVPKDFNKGTCVEFLMEHWEQQNSQPDRYPIYVGDDLTDEAAFVAVNRLGGTSIRVGEANTNTQAQNTVNSINLLYNALTQIWLG